MLTGTLTHLENKSTCMHLRIPSSMDPMGSKWIWIHGVLLISAKKSRVSTTAYG